MITNTGAPVGYGQAAVGYGQVPPLPAGGQVAPQGMAATNGKVHPGDLYGSSTIEKPPLPTDSSNL